PYMMSSHLKNPLVTDKQRSAVLSHAFKQKYEAKDILLHKGVYLTNDLVKARESIWKKDSPADQGLPFGFLAAEEPITTLEELRIQVSSIARVLEKALAGSIVKDGGNPDQWGVEFTGWPKEAVGFSDSEWMSSVVALLKRLEAERIDVTPNLLYKRLEVNDLSSEGSGKIADAKLTRASEAAFRSVSKQYPGYVLVVKAGQVPKELSDEEKLKHMSKVVGDEGCAVVTYVGYCKLKERGAERLSEVEECKEPAADSFVVRVAKLLDDKVIFENFVLLSRESINDEWNHDWETIVDTRGSEHWSAPLLLSVLDALQTANEREKLSVATLAARWFPNETHDWWNSGVRVRLSPFKTTDMCWAFSRFAQVDGVRPEAALELLHFLEGRTRPCYPPLEKNGRLVTAQIAREYPTYKFGDGTSQELGPDLLKLLALDELRDFYESALKKELDD
ncbi:MAG: hypothetical protein KDB07_09865, partial [Planctomycetes bacterium]|nr:hypothetical protein [Planctomycetota bacterium]